jgi:dienelactone hydrolase
MSKLNLLLAVFCTIIFSSCEFLNQVAKQQGNQGSPGQNSGSEAVVLQGTVSCDYGNRYVDPVFPANNIKLFSDIVYATATPQEQWNNGKVSSECYGVRDYKTANGNGSEDFKLDIYMPDPAVDQCNDRALVLLVHQGGFSQRETPNKTFGSVAGRAKYLAQLGYVVAVMDYRKGFDFDNSNTYANGSLAALIMPTINLDCKETNTPDPKSFQVALFRFMQDIRAAHRFLHKNNEKIGVDNDKVFYMGLSTGAIGIAHAAYATDETQHWNSLGLGSIGSYGNFPEVESQIKVAGVLAEQPALHKAEWLEATDNVPMYMMQGAADMDVPFGEGYLAGLTSYNKGQAGMPYFKLFGAKSLYDQFAKIGGNSKSVGHLAAFEGVNHHLAPMTSGACNDLKNGLRGIWVESYKFAKEIIQSVDENRTANIKTGYCLYKNPSKFNCTKECQ